MKKVSLTIAAMACISLSILSSCRFTCIHGSGKRISEQRKVNDFKKIDISGDFKIHLKQDSSLGITVSGDDNLLKYVSTSVEGDKLIIKNKKRTCDADSIVVNIGVRNLVEIKSSGASDIQSTGKLNTGDLRVDVSGASKVELDVNAANFSVNSSGVLKLDLVGQAATAKIESSGVNKVNAFNFVVGEYTITASGVSKCYINVLKTLNVHSSGASEIEYKGSPATINNDKSGASKIKKVD
jgi:hypothetical protein